LSHDFVKVKARRLLLAPTRSTWRRRLRSARLRPLYREYRRGRSRDRARVQQWHLSVDLHAAWMARRPISCSPRISNCRKLLSPPFPKAKLSCPIDAMTERLPPSAKL